MMKSWKLALENLGFLRWKYEKKEHVHCMAFRKVEELILPCPSSAEASRLSQMLYIPQDFTDACYDDVPQQSGVLTEDNSSDFVSTACELPFPD
ncbi:25S rRNA (adenine2142-N1)-methyltransferase [Bulinus truncatus]|nr:25S rRNA (adenine2142-N1)-methyltransferase [Bulinus truncatus]